MAEDGDVKLKVTADSSQAQKELKGVEGRLKKTGKAAKAAGKKMVKAGRDGAKALKTKVGSATKDVVGKLQGMSAAVGKMLGPIALVATAFAGVGVAVAAVSAALEAAKQKAIEVRGSMDALVQRFQESETAMASLHTTLGDVAPASDTASTFLRKSNILFDAWPAEPVISTRAPPTFMMPP